MKAIAWGAALLPVLAAAALVASCSSSGEGTLALSLEASPAGLKTGESAVVTVRATETNGDPAADGTQVHLSVDPALGTVLPATVTTTAGVATALFQAGAVPGTATLTAASGEAVARTQVTIAGRTIARIVLADWKLHERFGATFTISGGGFEVSWRPRTGETRDVELPRGGDYHLLFRGMCVTSEFEDEFNLCGTRHFPEGEVRVVTVEGPCGLCSYVCCDSFGP